MDREFNNRTIGYIVQTDKSLREKEDDDNDRADERADADDGSLLEQESPPLSAS